MTDLGNTSHAVRAQRHEAPDSLDFFPTPPWAVRAFCEEAELDPHLELVAYDPCCGQGHMAVALDDYFGEVVASDIHPYGFGEVGDFLGGNLDPPWIPSVPVDWVFMNPPFNKALEFVETSRARFPNAGVAVLIRTAWMESKGRYERIFSNRETRPHHVFVSVERIAMVKGRYDHKASTATSYSWFVWEADDPPVTPTIRWIAPGGREKYFRDEDTLIGKDLSPAQEEKA